MKIQMKEGPIRTIILKSDPPKKRTIIYDKYKKNIEGRDGRNYLEFPYDCRNLYFTQIPELIYVVTVNNKEIIKFYPIVRDSLSIILMPNTYRSGACFGEPISYEENLIEKLISAYWITPFNNSGYFQNWDQILCNYHQDQTLNVFPFKNGPYHINSIFSAEVVNLIVDFSKTLDSKNE